MESRAGSGRRRGHIEDWSEVDSASLSWPLGGSPIASLRAGSALGTTGSASASTTRRPGAPLPARGWKLPPTSCSPSGWPLGVEAAGGPEGRSQTGLRILPGPKAPGPGRASPWPPGGRRGAEWRRHLPAPGSLWAPLGVDGGLGAGAAPDASAHASAGRGRRDCSPAAGRRAPERLILPLEASRIGGSEDV
ncbi:unnamed protein product [Prorocentrum cordatum]|uniref:Uncharacterized protein n=1 Tax=Prorocentrum cordatum TaxID=2364126 RepID=A0ABN9PZX6_9DINO|nr:unnamed protein product [Polarella glacialis]